MYQEITAKTLLSKVKQPDRWFGLTYNMNLYRGCQHQCIYCDSRSECYRIEEFSRIQAKTNAIERLRWELAGKRVKGTIGTGSMNDPYMPLEATLNLTGRALAVIAEFRFPVHVITKGDLVVRDVDTLVDISRVYAAVSFSFSTADDDLARKVEPGAPPPSARFAAMAALARRGILTGVTFMPVLPFVTDTVENITQIVTMARDSGAGYILPWFGMTLRDRQRAWYYDKLDRHFPGVKERYQERFGNNYQAAAPNWRELDRHFHDLCREFEIPTRIPCYTPQRATQLVMF